MNYKDRNFDDLTRKFDSNIYGTSKGKLRHELILHYLQTRVLSQPEFSLQGEHRHHLRLLDAGGGTGEMTRSLAAMGYPVTLNDLSQTSLQVAREKCQEFAWVNYVAGSIQDMVQPKHFDLVTCHAVLEWVEDPAQLLEKLVSLTRSGGYLSITFYNQNAQLFSNMVYGNFQFVSGGMKKRNQVRLTPHSPLEPTVLYRLLDALPVTTVLKAGIRCFHDYVRDKEVVADKYDELLMLEKRYGTQEPYLSLGKYIQVILQVN